MIRAARRISRDAFAGQALGDNTAPSMVRLLELLWRLSPTTPRDGVWLGLDEHGTPIARADFARPLTVAQIAASVMVGVAGAVWTRTIDPTLAWWWLAVQFVGFALLGVFAIGGRSSIVATHHRTARHGFYGHNFASINRGTGTATEFARAVTERLGDPAITIHVRRNLTALIAHYQTLGFSPTGPTRRRLLRMHRPAGTSH